MTTRKILISAIALLIVLPLLTFQSLWAQSGNQWRIDYYPNTEWAGNPVYTQYSNLISFDWGTGSPGPGIPVDNFTARMTSDAFFYAGIYRFNILADDEFVLYVDNVARFSTVGQGLSGKNMVFDIQMFQGTHNIRVDYREFTGSAYIFVNWVYFKPDNSGGNVPPPTPTPTVPPTPTTLVTPYGDYTPCMQQNIHQSNCFQASGQWDSPNLGSIQMEPQITVWGLCTADTWTTMVVDASVNPPRTQSFKCSKTEAGWFPA